MAASVPATVPDASYTVPEWVERNSKLFKTPPPRFDASTIKRAKPVDMHLVRTMVASTFSGNTQLDAGVGAAELTDDGMGNIDLPTGPQPADYWRNIENHGNILVTLITTARRKVGFVPSLSGSQFTKEEADEYARKFSAWMNELDSYSPYINLVDWAQQTAENNSTNCNVIIKGVTDFVVGLTGLAGPLAVALTTRVTGLVKSAADYVTSHGTAVNAGFQLETTETTGTSDPTQPISYASTFMSRTQSGKGVSEQSSITLASFIYKLNSAAIISMADKLAAGSTLSGSKQYRDYVNGPLNST